MSFHAHAAHSPKSALKPFVYEPAPLGPHDVEIRISHCGICHSDVHLVDGDWGMGSYPMVPGHEIVGTVTALGPEVRHLEAGARVGVGWQRGACLVCDSCIAGDENLCAQNVATCVGHASVRSEVMGEDYKRVARPDEVPRGRRRVGEQPQRRRPVGRTDPGADAVPRVDGHRVRRAAGVLVDGDHRRQPERVGELVRHRRAEHARRVPDGPADPARRRVLGGEDDVTLVLAVLVVDDEDGQPAPDRVDRRLDRVEPDGRLLRGAGHQPTSSKLGSRGLWTVRDTVNQTKNPQMTNAPYTR